MEVRVSTYAERVMRRWYIVVLAMIAGGGIVLLHGVGRSTGQYDATATVYLGQPQAVGGGQALSQFTNASAVQKLITSDATLAAAAKAAGVRVQSLRGRITAHLLSSSATTTSGQKTTTGATYYQVEAQGPWGGRRTGIIVNTLATRLRDAANVFVDAKVRQLNLLIGSEERTLADLSRANARARTVIEQNLRAGTSSSTDALIAATLLSANTTTINDTQTALSDNRLLLASAQKIEAASITTRAAGHSVTARTRRSSLIVGVFVGFIVGVLLALLWDSLRARPRSVT
jgi:capsular polysaccharide biosynthesis protein